MISKEIIFNAFYNSKTKKEFLNIIGIPYEHKSGTSINNDIKHFLEYAGINDDYSAKAFIERNKVKEEIEYNKNPKYCSICGKIIPFNKRFNKFCSQSCASTYSNIKRGNHSEISNLKSSQSNKETFKNKGGKYISECIKEGILENPFNYLFKDRLIKISSCKEHICPECGKKYHTYLQKSGNLSNWKCCSKECNIKHSNKIIYDKVQERIKNGIFSGWQSRNIDSYSEKFWINVLKNNNIQYIREFHLDKKYFIDFYLEKNNKYIDLEIDGKQHKYDDRIIHDKERDEYISNKGIIIYRIDWNEINTKSGSKLMKEKIDKFLDFYNNL